MSTSYPALGRFFGLEKEKKIADSGIRNIFTPHQPIAESDLLFGRQIEVQKLVETLNTPGQHVLLYGERGVGKSSLANVVASLLTVISLTPIYVKRCDQSDTFESIVKGPLAEVGADLTLVNVSEENGKKIAGDIKLIKGEKAKSILATYAASHSLSPSTVAEAIGELTGLLVVDEADAVGNPEDRRKLAELIKLLSDAGSNFKVMIVGIATTGEELTAAHPSVQRCLKETQLSRMTDVELREIVEAGGRAAKLDFTPEVVTSIVRLSAGYPHFTHLISLKCAERAVTEGRKTISKANLTAALELAVADAEISLKRVYDEATRSGMTEMYRSIVFAAATVTSEEFTSSVLRAAIEERTGTNMTQGSLNNFLQRLVSDDGASILRRTAKGVYRFSDPRMASYVRMATEVGEPPPGA
jgi:Cdc6-like AAA superfamily ATPase